MVSKVALKQGSAFIWFIFIVSVIILGFGYSVLMKPVEVTYNLVYNDLNVSAQVYQDFFTMSKTIWMWTPLVIVLCLFFWAILRLHEAGT